MDYVTLISFRIIISRSPSELIKQMELITLSILLSTAMHFSVSLYRGAQRYLSQDERDKFHLNHSTSSTRLTLCTITTFIIILLKTMFDWSNHNVPHVGTHGDFRSEDILISLLWESLMTLIHAVISKRVSPIHSSPIYTYEFDLYLHTNKYLMIINQNSY